MFKVGDVVECIDNTQVEGVLTLGDYYAVISCDLPHITVMDREGIVEEFFAHSFRSIAVTVAVSHPDLQAQIDNVMDNFNFSRVFTTMQALKWRWASSKSSDGVPIDSELRERARKLLKEVSVRGGIVGTGGFYAENCGSHLSLQFVVEEWGYE